LTTLTAALPFWQRRVAGAAESMMLARLAIWMLTLVETPCESAVALPAELGLPDATVRRSVATPLLSVDAVLRDNVPVELENVTATPRIGR
jgi:hypothetical protein